MSLFRFWCQQKLGVYILWCSFLCYLILVLSSVIIYLSITLILKYLYKIMFATLVAISFLVTQWTPFSIAMCHIVFSHHKTQQLRNSLHYLLLHSASFFIFYFFKKRLLKLLLHLIKGVGSKDPRTFSL